MYLLQQFYVTNKFVCLWQGDVMEISLYIHLYFSATKKITPQQQNEDNQYNIVDIWHLNYVLLTKTELLPRETR